MVILGSGFPRAIFRMRTINLKVTRNLCNFVEQSKSKKTEVILDRIIRVNEVKLGLDNNEVETNECMHLNLFFLLYKYTYFCIT